MSMQCLICLVNKKTFVIINGKIINNHLIFALGWKIFSFYRKKYVSLQTKTKHLHEKAFIQVPNDQYRTALGTHLFHHLYPSRANWRHDHYLIVHRYGIGFYSRVQKFEEINTFISSFISFPQKQGKKWTISFHDIFIHFSFKNKQNNYFFFKKSRILFVVSIFIYTFAAVFIILRNKLT